MKVVVIGAGAAGLTSAIFAARAGAQVIVLERTKEAGKKILMSGGTRCNVLPRKVDIQHDYYSSSSLSKVKRVFNSWNLKSCHEWMTKDIGLDLVEEEETNKFFPRSNDAREVRDRLYNCARSLGVQFQFNSPIHKISKIKSSDGDSDCWQCEIQSSSSSNIGDQQKPSTESVTADSIVVSTGGLSYPTVGTDGMGHTFMKQIGHSIEPTFPALTPLEGRHPAGAKLHGISLNVRATVEQQSERKKNSNIQAHRSGFLFTHRGFSGPSILDLSHYIVKDLEKKRNENNPHEDNNNNHTAAQRHQIYVNWIDQPSSFWENQFIEHRSKTLVSNRLKQFMPDRLADAICDEAGLKERIITDLSVSERKTLVELLTRWPLKVTGHGGYRLAEVTGGGIPLDELSTATLESKLTFNNHDTISSKPSRLFACGEIVDIHGRIGGFNFYWAWLSGRLAGINAARINRDK